MSADLATVIEAVREDPDAAHAAVEKVRMQQSLLLFFERAWPVIDPKPIKLNWHHECIVEHLEAVTRGEIRRLIINVPPRSSKTNLGPTALPGVG